MIRTRSPATLFHAMLLTCAIPIAGSAQAEEQLTDAQQALYRALRPDAAPAGEPLAATTSDLEAAVLEYQAQSGTLPAGYQLAIQESALDGIPEDGLPHSVRVARDSFVLLGADTVFAFRRVVDCVGSVQAEGAMQGIPQVHCDN